MNYTLHQLHVFLTLSRIGSVTKAALELNMTQPAVSMQLKNLQQQFDIPLMEVIGRKIFITEFGKEIAQMAERVLNEAEAIKYKTNAYKGMLTGQLRISSVSTGKYVIPYYLSDFIQENDGIDLVLDVTNKTRVLESLKQNKLDFALVSVMPENIEVEEETLLENRLFLMGGANTQRKDLNLRKRYENVPFIYREPGSATRIAMEKFLDFSKANSRKRIELTSNEAVKQAVIAGLGFSIIPQIGVHNELENGTLKIHEVQGLPIVTKWRLVWLKAKRLSPVAEAFLEYIRENKKQIEKRKFGWLV